jgi:serine/threonine protein kinase
MALGEQAWLKERIAQISGVEPPKKIDIITDTTEFMNIYRGQVLELEGRYFLITGNIYESRFGLNDEPKYWVKKAIDMETRKPKIIKLVYNEEFHVRVGPLKIRCYRTQRKESRVLELVTGHPRFMQGRALFDRKGNEVRVIDYIRGKSLHGRIFEMNMPHEKYFFTIFPGILKKLVDCFKSIQFIHENGLCHGDIRNDHIMVENETSNYRWIDFDLSQDFSDFDIWSIGNVLQFCSGMGMRTFHEIVQSKEFSDSVKLQLNSDDASAFYQHRIMNLKKLFPYIPDKLNDILLHFTINTNRFYESVDQIVSDVGSALDALSQN